MSSIANRLGAEPRTIHHAVLVMDLFASNFKQDYDTELVSLVSLMISSKYHQIEHLRANSLRNMVQRMHTYEQILQMEARVLKTIDWQLMLFPMYDYLDVFVNQGCLFTTDRILRSSTTHPSSIHAENFRERSKFFAKFCLSRSRFMRKDPYLMTCAVIAYTRK